MAPTRKAKSAYQSGRPGHRLRNDLEIRPQISISFSRKLLRPGSAQTRRGNDSGNRLQFRWADAISRAEWRTYKKAIKAVRDARIPCLLGGGFALATFTGHWR